MQSVAILKSRISVDCAKLWFADRFGGKIGTVFRDNKLKDNDKMEN
jgi:hypothetical protein